MRFPFLDRAIFRDSETVPKVFLVESDRGESRLILYLTINRAGEPVTDGGNGCGEDRCLLAHLFVRIHVYVTLDALLAHISPTVARHPFTFALGTLVFAKAPLLALIRRQALALRSCLWKLHQFSWIEKFVKIVKIASIFLDWKIHFFIRLICLLCFYKYHKVQFDNNWTIESSKVACVYWFTKSMDALCFLLIAVDIVNIGIKNNRVYLILF